MDSDSNRAKSRRARVAHDPGDRMAHCHILEHQPDGMTGVVRAA